MLVVVDTNVIIGALFEYDEWCLKILAEESRGIFKFVFNHETATELLVIVTEIFGQKHADKPTKYRVLSKILAIIFRSKQIEQKTFCALCAIDPNDNKFINCAIDSKASFIITQNNEHLSEDLEPLIKKNYNHIVRIATPFQFKRILLKEKYASHNAR